MTAINVLLFLFLGHVICDFYIQPKSWVDKRNEVHYKAPQLAYHALLHGLISTFVLLLAKNDLSVSLSFGFFILVTHYIVDLIKSYCPNTAIFFALDQLAHLTVLLIVWLSLTGEFSEYKELLTLDKLHTKHVAIFIAYLIILKPASIIISMTLRPWSDDVNTGSESKKDTPNFAGQRIGYLERILILTFIILNQLAAIGFLLTAKSVFRFGDLTRDEDKKLTEYVMLGTLTSFTITILIGLVIVQITP